MITIYSTNTNFSIDPQYVSKEEETIWINANINITAKGLSFHEDIELYYEDFVLLLNQLEKLICNKCGQMEWNNIDENILFSVTYSEFLYKWEIRYNIDNFEDNYLHLVCSLTESDMNLVICELSSTTDWVSMCLKQNIR